MLGIHLMEWHTIKTKTIAIETLAKTMSLRRLVALSGPMVMLFPPDKTMSSRTDNALSTTRTTKGPNPINKKFIHIR